MSDVEALFSKRVLATLVSGGCRNGICSLRNSWVVTVREDPTAQEGPTKCMSGRLGRVDVWVAS